MEKSLEIFLVILLILLPLGCFIVVFCCCSNKRRDVATKKIGRKNRWAISHSLDVNSDEVAEDHDGCDVEDGGGCDSGGGDD